MNYDYAAIPQERVPRAPALFQHALDIYAGETNKVVSVWRGFQDADLAFRPHPRSSTVAEILKHQLLSERRFFAEFLGCAGTGAGSDPARRAKHWRVHAAHG